MVVNRLYSTQYNAVSSDITINSEVLQEAIKRVYNQEYDTLTDIDVKLLNEFWRVFDQAIDVGVSAERQAEYPELFAQMRYNNGVFSAFKVHRFANDMAAQLFDSNGVLKPFERWLSDVKGIISHQTEDWLQTEYATAINRAHIAAQWKQFEAEADVLPNLKWLPSTSVDIREEHEQYYGIVLPIWHPFWLNQMPGTLFNCKCGLTNTDEPVTPERDIPTNITPPADGLETNPATDGKIFSNKHPYIAHANGNALDIFKRLVDEN